MSLAFPFARAKVASLAGFLHTTLAACLAVYVFAVVACVVLAAAPPAPPPQSPAPPQAPERAVTAAATYEYIQVCDAEGCRRVRLIQHTQAGDHQEFYAQPYYGSPYYGGSCSGVGSPQPAVGRKRFHLFGRPHVR